MAITQSKKSERSFTALSLTLLLFSIAVVILLNLAQDNQLEGWGLTAARLMLYYIVFIVARSGILLILSLLEHAYEEVDKESSYCPLVSIIMPCFNEENVISDAIASLSNLNYPNYEVLVVDDGSFDLTSNIAQKFEDKHRLRVIFQENQGKAAALNRGISEAVGDFILCMDADSILDPNVLQYGMPYFERDPLLAAVAGSVNVGNTKGSLLAKLQKLEYIIGLNFHKKAQSFLNMVTIVPGPVGLFKKSAVEKIGGYHSNTFAEDCDLSMRLLLAGYNIKYCYKMVAVTEAPIDLNSLLIQRYRWTRGTIQAITKNAKFLGPKGFDFRKFMIVLYMLSETVLIPTINYVFSMLTISYALTHNVIGLFGPYFIGLSILDLALSLYSVIFEKQAVSLFLLAAANRFTYGFMLEITRFFSIFDEIFRIPMKWGAIPRRGMGG